MLIAQIIVAACAVYLTVGVIFGFYFVLFGITRMDRAAEGAGIGFRALIFFGAVPFWPFLVQRVLRTTREPVESNAHRASAIAKKNDQKT